MLKPSYAKVSERAQQIQPDVMTEFVITGLAHFSRVSFWSPALGGTIEPRRDHVSGYASPRLALVLQSCVMGLEDQIKISDETVGGLPWIPAKEPVEPRNDTRFDYPKLSQAVKLGLLQGNFQQHPTVEMYEFKDDREGDDWFPIPGGFRVWWRRPIYRPSRPGWLYCLSSQEGTCQGEPAIALDLSVAKELLHRGGIWYAEDSLFGRLIIMMEEAQRERDSPDYQQGLANAIEDTLKHCTSMRQVFQGIGKRHYLSYIYPDDFKHYFE